MECKEEHKNTMSLLEQWLQPNAVISRRARVHGVVRVVGVLLSGAKLALTALRRHGGGRSFVKHPIKTVDRNYFLVDENLNFVGTRRLPENQLDLVIQIARLRHPSQG